MPHTTWFVMIGKGKGGVSFTHVIHEWTYIHTQEAAGDSIDPERDAPNPNTQHPTLHHISQSHALTHTPASPP